MKNCIETKRSPFDALLLNSKREKLKKVSGLRLKRDLCTSDEVYSDVNAF